MESFETLVNNLALGLAQHDLWKAFMNFSYATEIWNVPESDSLIKIVKNVSMLSCA